MIYKALVKDDQTNEVSTVSCEVDTVEEMYETLGKNGYIPFKGMVKPMETFDMLMSIAFYFEPISVIWEEESGTTLSSESLNYLLNQCKKFNRELKYLTSNEFFNTSNRINSIIDYLKSIGKDIHIKQTQIGHYLYQGDII